MELMLRRELVEYVMLKYVTWQWNYVCVTILDMNMLTSIPLFFLIIGGIFVAGTSTKRARTPRAAGRCSAP
jgi:surface polysaccharide O-acyltransferase-like enzyme